ncbi:MAG: ArsR family transcriptional regulator [Chloroflexi bacterium]|nr:ArsR family transcriptional regulator [Chloroflexota bacterium]
MHTSRQRILEILRQRGATTVEELSQELTLTTVTVRHHLDILRGEGLVGDPLVMHNSRPGRPQYAYALTEQAWGMFPTNYASLAVQLISELKARTSQQEVLTFFDCVGNRLVAGTPRPEAGQPLEARLERAVGYLNEQGYLARWEHTPEGYLIHTCNCPYRGVSGVHQELCCMDLSLVSALVGSQLERRGRVIEGDESCAYLLVRAAAAVA